METRVPDRCRTRAPLRSLAAALASLAFAGCTSMTQPFDTFIPLVTQFGVYKLDINQGNYLSQDMVDKLKVGQTKQQVRLALGTPLITNAFHDNRWDYVYRVQERRARARAPAVHRLLQGRRARALGRRRDAAVRAGPQPHRRRPARCPRIPTARTPDIIGKIIDVFKKIYDPAGKPVP